MTAPGAAMSAGLAALLDDVALIARAAATSVDDVAAGAGRASMKAAGVIVDDATVTPRYETVGVGQPARRGPGGVCERAGTRA